MDLDFYESLVDVQWLSSAAGSFGISQCCIFFSFQILVDLIVLMNSPLGVLMNGAVQRFVGLYCC